MVFGKSLSQRSESNRWRADGVRVENIHYIGHSWRDSKIYDRITVWNLRQFKGRIIFLSMYNDIIWRETKKHRKNVRWNSVTVATYARRFLLGRWSFFGSWIREDIFTELILLNQMETGTGLLNEGCSTFAESVSSYIPCHQRPEKRIIKKQSKG